MEQLNDEDSCTIYDPAYITHYNVEKELHKFHVNIKEPELAIYDHSFSYCDNTRVVYNKSNSNTGSAGFMVRVDGVPFSKKLTINLATTATAKAQNYLSGSMQSKTSLTSYENLGKAAYKKLSTTSDIKHKAAIPLEQETLIREKAAKIRAALPNTSNYDEYLSFIEGTGVTEDEYWELIINHLIYESTQDTDEEK